MIPFRIPKGQGCRSCIVGKLSGVILFVLPTLLMCSFASVMHPPASPCQDLIIGVLHGFVDLGADFLTLFVLSILRNLASLNSAWK